MNDDGIVLAFYGFILVVAGIGLLFVRLGSTSYKNDTERYGPLSNINMGMAYMFIRTDRIKKIVAVVVIAAGVALIICAKNTHP